MKAVTNMPWQTEYLENQNVIHTGVLLVKQNYICTINRHVKLECRHINKTWITVDADRRQRLWDNGDGWVIRLCVCACVCYVQQPAGAAGCLLLTALGKATYPTVLHSLQNSLKKNTCCQSWDSYIGVQGRLQLSACVCVCVSLPHSYVKMF